MDLVIDASNLRQGGGITHLSNVLAEGEPSRSGIGTVEVWANPAIAPRLQPRPWLQVRHHPAFDRGTIARTVWQQHWLSRYLHGKKETLLWAPGGSYVGSFRPFVTMSRSLLPFEPEARRHYRDSVKGLRLALLRRSQARTLHRCQGAIFLTNFARQRVLEQIGALSCPTTTIAHGIGPQFFCEPRPTRSFETFTAAEPARLLYVSHLSFYKHHVEVLEAMALLRAGGVFAQLTLAGPAPEKAAKEAFFNARARIDPDEKLVRYVGEIPYAELVETYRTADLFVFASSVETFGNILVEAMAAGLPIASSNRSAMPEMIGNAGVFFDPSKPPEIAAAIEDTLRNASLRAELARRAYTRAGEFSWKKCADATFEFLRHCYAAAGRT